MSIGLIAFTAAVSAGAEGGTGPARSAAAQRDREYQAPLKSASPRQRLNGQGAEPASYDITSSRKAGMTSKQDLIEAIERLPDTTSESSLEQIAAMIAGIRAWEEDGVV